MSKKDTLDQLDILERRLSEFGGTGGLESPTSVGVAVLIALARQVTELVSEVRGLRNPINAKR